MFITKLVQVNRETTQAITLQTVKWEASVSVLAQDTNYPDRFFVGFITALWKMTRGQIKLGHDILYLYQCHFPPIIRFFTSRVADSCYISKEKNLDQAINYGILCRIVPSPFL